MSTCRRLECALILKVDELRTTEPIDDTQPNRDEEKRIYFVFFISFIQGENVMQKKTNDE